MPARRTVFLLGVLFTFPGVVQGASPEVVAITGGTVHPASGPEIQNGMVVVRGGLIEAVGSGLPIPADARVLDVKGGHVYPGLIDAQTSLGFPSPRPAARRRGGAARPATPQQELPETSSAFVAARAVNLADEDLDARRGIGVTTIVTAPAFGIFNGQSAMLNLGNAPESRVIKSPASIQVSFNPRGSSTYPDSLMGVIAYIRQTFVDAQQYGAARAIYEKNPAGARRPDASESLEALQSALNRSLPVVFVADTDLMMRRAAAIAREFDLRYALSGARQAYRMTDELKASGAPLLVSVKWAVPPASKEDREEQPLRVIRDRRMQSSTPAALARSGIPFALVSGPAKAGEFLPGIRKAVESGLSVDDALRATTLWPARIFGVDRQLGSLERGKIANVVVTDKPIFARESKVKHVFVDGRELRVLAPETRAGESGASAINGSWALTVRIPQGEVAIQAVFRFEEGKLSGTYSGPGGSGDLSGGRFDGTEVEFTISVRGQQESESGDWVFRGTLGDGTLDGSVTMKLGTFAFTGSKSR